tara:strand:+ start:627 stop:875 length:249 start_codon:yes stop_codon:yes gene_type:complete
MAMTPSKRQVYNRSYYKKNKERIKTSRNKKKDVQQEGEWDFPHDIRDGNWESFCTSFMKGENGKEIFEYAQPYDGIEEDACH